MRPIELGVSGGNINDIGKAFCCTGTIGSLVSDGAGARFVLSNNHVLARQRTTPSSEVDEEIVQPGLADNSCQQDAADAVANLSAWVPLDFSGAVNQVDAAIAAVVSDEVDPNGTIKNIGGISGTTAAPTLNLAVQKMGRTTCLTKGAISDVSVNVRVRYDKKCGEAYFGRALFTNQLMITTPGFSASGDSGSLIVTDEACPRAIGLLFAGSASSAIANPIGEVLTALGVKMAGSCTAATSLAGATSAGGSASGVGASSAPGRGLERARQVRDRNERRLMRARGVVGSGISTDVSGRPLIRVYVKEITPEVRSEVPPAVEGVPVEIVETGEIVAF